MNKVLNELFNELVPASGKAESLAGEIVRAVSRIGYRFFNDGDRVNQGYGKETCNPAARFLSQKAPEAIAIRADRLLASRMNDEEYEKALDELVQTTYDVITAHPELRQQETGDMWDWYDENEDRDDSWDDEYEDEEYAEEEYEY
jgi:hypothetical protein